MLVKVSQSDFYEKLQIVQRGTSSQSTLPILTGIKINADAKDSIFLHSTDLELSMKVDCPAAVKTKGSLVVNGKLLADIFKYIPDGTVDLSLENEGRQLHITAGRSSFKVQTMPVDDFPAFPTSEEGQEIDLEGPVLLEALKQTSKAISKDETRPVLTGALLKIDKNSMLVVATDSYRLAFRSSKIKNTKKVEFSVLVPYRAVEEIQKLSAVADRINLSTDGNLLKAETNKGQIFTRLIEGQFPNYEQLIPKEAKLTVSVEKNELSGAINQASLMAQKNMSIKISVKDGEIKISAATAGVGEVDSTIKANTTGETIEDMAFNAQYLLDGIQTAPGDSVILEFNGSVNPGLIKSKADTSYMYLVMPIRIS